MIVFSDLHLREANEQTVWAALQKIEELAVEEPDRQVVFCGDWWQVRYRVSVRLLNEVDKLFDDWMCQGIMLDLVPGNHDQVTVDGANALEILARTGVEVWTEPGYRGSMGFIPYRKDPEDQVGALQAVQEALQQQTVKPLIFGHFGLRGAKMDSGRTDHDGIVLPEWSDPTLLVLGHYHQHQWVSGAVYVGSAFEHSFGEVANRAGVLRICRDAQGSWVVEHIPLGVGPRHHIVTWDLAERAEPPQAGRMDEADRVRVDIKAPPSLINPDLIARLQAAGYGDAQVTVESVAEQREHRFATLPGESLCAAAERFVAHRLEVPVPVPADDPRIRKLRELAGE